MPFAEITAIISSVSQSPSERWEGFLDVYLVGDDARLVRISPGLYAGAAGLAERLGDVGLTKDDTVFRYAIRAGGLEIGVSCATHPIGDLLIGHDKEDVGEAVYASEGI